MTKKIFQSIIAVAVAVLLAAVVIIVGVLYTYFEGEYADELRNEALYAASGLESSGFSYLNAVTEAEQTDTRITLIEEDGTVLFDSRADASEMENHADREEIRDALKNGEGYSTQMCIRDSLSEILAACCMLCVTIITV